MLNDPRTASTLPNIYDEKQLTEFAKAPDTPALTQEEMDQIESLYAVNFWIEEETPKFKATMELAGTDR
jgi:hypothetical protein